MAANPTNLSQIISVSKIKVDSIASIINAVVLIFIPLSGIVLLGVIISAGFQILTGANNPEKVEKGKKTLTQGIIGFFIIFLSFWIAKVLEVIFNFPIISN